MAYVDDLLVDGDTMATQQFLQQFQQHLELKHTTQLTISTSLEFLGKTNCLRQLNFKMMVQSSCSSQRSTTTRS
eukprot:5613787-Amphidinium_carterae.1